MPWSIIGAIALAGLATLVCGLHAHQVELEEEGEKRIVFGGGTLGAALMLAIGKSIYEYGRIAGWWAA